MLGFHNRITILIIYNIVLALILIEVHVQPMGVYTSVIYYVN